MQNEPLASLNIKKKKKILSLTDIKENNARDASNGLTNHLYVMAVC